MIKHNFIISAQPLEFYKGGGGMPPPPDPQAEASARDWEAQRQSERENARRLEDRRIADEKAAKELTAWQGRRSNAMLNAQDYGKQQLSRFGLSQDDPYGIWSSFNSQLTRNNSQLMDNQDFTAQLGNNVFDSVLSTARGDQRSKMTRDFNNSIGANYLEDTFADTVDDPYLDAILNEQFEEAQGYLNSARDRGQLNMNSFERAIGSLGKEKNRARGELETIGRGVLSTVRDDVGRRKDSTLQRINAFDFGDNINIGDEVGRVKSKATSALGSLDSEIRRSLGSREFFDPNSLVAKSAAFSGASNYNPTSSVGGSGSTNPLLAVFTDQERNKTTQGAF
jgi:hypothetical protein